MELFWLRIVDTLGSEWQKVASQCEKRNIMKQIRNRKTVTSIVLELDVNTDMSQYMLQGSMIVRMPEANSSNWAGWLVVEPRSANKKTETTQCMLGAATIHVSMRGPKNKHT